MLLDLEAAMDTPELLFAAVGRTVIAMDRFNGRPVWRVKLPGAFFGGSISMILPFANEVYVGRGGYVYCLDRASGRVVWERGVGSSSGVTLLALTGGAADQQQASASSIAAMQAAATASAAAVVATTAAAGSN